MSKKKREQIEIVNYNAEQQKKVAEDKEEIQRIEIDRINQRKAFKCQKIKRRARG